MERGFLRVELPVLLLLSSTLIFRVRTNQQLADNPLDSAAALRVLCVLAAAALAGDALLASRPSGSHRRRPVTSLPSRLYLLYAGAALLGAPFSVLPLQTLYRVWELFMAVLVMAAAYWVAGESATRRIEAVVYWFLTAALIAVWIGLIVAPGHALEKPPTLGTTTFLDVNLVGVFPAVSANSVGANGMLLAVWSFARLLAPLRRGVRYRSAFPLFILGVASLLLAQYRTGYAAFAVGIVVVLGVRRREVLIAGAVGGLCVLAFAPGMLGSVEPYALRGQSYQEASQLSGRLDYWRGGLRAWRESPIVGRGLRTASRYEVLVGKDQATTAGIHSTWVEVLLGTGLLGLTLFIATVLVALARAWRVARAGSILPLVILSVLLVRTYTGNTFESSSFDLVLFLALTNSLTDRWLSPGPRPPAWAEPPLAVLADAGRKPWPEPRTQEPTN